MTQELINQLDKHDMFVTLSLSEKKKLKTLNKITGVRNDGVGARLMCLANTIRISRKLDKDFIFYWDTDLNSLRVGKRTEKEKYQMKTNKTIFNFIPNFKDKIIFFDSQNNVIKSSIKEWKILIFYNENKNKVILEIKKIIKEIFLNNKINYNKNIIFKYGVNIRGGDIDCLRTRISNKNERYNVDFNLGKWYPISVWQSIFNKLNDKTIIGSNDYDYLNKTFEFKKNFKILNNHQYKKNLSHNYLIDLLSIANCKIVICSLMSGTGLILAFLSKKTLTPEKFLKIDKIFFEFSDIIKSEYFKYNKLESLISHFYNYIIFKLRMKVHLFKVNILNILNN